MHSLEIFYDLGYLPIAFCMLGLSLYKTRAWLNERIPSLLIMTGAALTSAVGFTSAAPVFYRQIDNAVGRSNFATLVVYSAITMCCAFFLLLVRLWSGNSSPTEEQGRRETELQRLRVAGKIVGPAYIVLLILMATFFLRSHIPTGEKPLTFDASFAATPCVTTFLLLFQAGYGFANWSMAFLTWRYSRQLGDSDLSAGLRITSTGCVFIAFYGVLKIVAIIGIIAGVKSMAPISNSVAPASASIGGAIAIVGWIHPARQGRRRRLREFRALESLWRVVTQEEPGLILRTKLPRSDWGLQLLAIRRAGEIRDGQLSLRPWISEHVVSEARRLAEEEDLRPSEREALAAAAALQGALKSRESETAPSLPCQTPPGMSIPPHAEREHLVLVGHFLNSHLVTQILQHTA
ncbi:MAB_1171c family putative transporter [Streptantibioticus parmotrematis]|uniref:MAB_1171c family putative transporter n=1 Tax=Streptantibioticus parmotrematis TaxID=2873249 RepID=UPI0035568894